MATIDNESLQESFEQHKAEFKQLSRAKKAAAAFIALVNGLLMLMELMLAIFLVKESVSVAKVTLCNICVEDLTHVLSHECERRTKTDVVFEKVIKHVDAEIKQCPTCKSIEKGQFPADMPGPLQYGNGLKAYIIDLLICRMVALNRVQKLVKSMMGTLISMDACLFVRRYHIKILA